MPLKLMSGLLTLGLLAAAAAAQSPSTQPAGGGMFPSMFPSSQPAGQPTPPTTQPAKEPAGPAATRPATGAQPQVPTTQPAAATTRPAVTTPPSATPSHTPAATPSLLQTINTPAPAAPSAGGHAEQNQPAGEKKGLDFMAMLFVFMMASFIGLGVIRRVSRLLHTPLMSLTNAISAIAVVGSLMLTGGDHPGGYRFWGAVALFASMTNIVSGFLITDRMLKMFKTREGSK